MKQQVRVLYYDGTEDTYEGVEDLDFLQNGTILRIRMNARTICMQMKDIRKVDTTCMKS